MKIDFESNNLRFVWDTESNMVDVYRPAKRIDRFELPNYSPKLNYRIFKDEAKKYVDFMYRRDKLNI